MKRSSPGWASRTALTMLLVGAVGCGGDAATSGTSSSNGDWYYHWNCNGDTQCLATEPGTPNQASGTLNEGPVQVNCTQLMQFASRFWGPSATNSCDQSATSSSGGTAAPTITGFTPASGPPGTNVTISGTGFPASTSQVTVTISGVIAAVAAATSTQIIVTIPALGDFKGPLHVTTSQGTVVSSGSFSVVNPLYGVTWSATKSLFAVVGAHGTILTSPDGVAWTAQASGVNLALQSDLHGVTWSGAAFVAVGDNGYTLVSADAVTWTIGSGTNGIVSLESVSSSGLQFVRVGSGSSVSTSVDGLAWTARPVPSDWYRGVTWSGSQFVAVGNGIITSPDGATWTSRIAPAAGFDGIAASGTLLVVVGNNGTIVTSPDGITWTLRTSGTTSTLNGVTWSGTRFVAVGSSGRIVTSPDGMTWTVSTSGTTNALNGVAWSGTKFLAVGDVGTVLTSADGVTWTATSAL